MSARIGTDRTTNPDVVALLEDYLEQAKSGRIVGVLIFAFDHEGGTLYDYDVPDGDDLLYELGSFILLERGQ